MNILVWSEMQTRDVIRQVDLMCPGIIEERDVEYRYTNHRQHISRNGNRSLKHKRSTAKAKIYAGLTLIGFGLFGLFDPTRFAQARIINTVFAMAGAYIGGMFGMPHAGFVYGTAIGNAVALTVIYGIPVFTIASGVWMMTKGMFEYHQLRTGGSSGSYLESFIA